MVRRISDLYKLDQHVEILLRGRSEEKWVAGIVVGFDFPGVWVRTREGHHWFVTNGRRIRPLEGSEEL